MNELILTDNSSRKYLVKEPRRLYNHLTKYHTTNKKADHSVQSFLLCCQVFHQEQKPKNCMKNFVSQQLRS